LSFNAPIEDVVQHGCCVGCGACSVATQGRIPVPVNIRGFREARLDDVSESDLRIGSSVCPFSSASANEDSVADGIPEIADLPKDRRIGKYRGVYAGQIKDDDRVQGSSSGGLTTWLLAQLLQNGDVDGVIHVGPTDSTPIFAYRVSTTIEELYDNRKSMYFSTTFADVVGSVRGDGKRYAFVGVPCFVTSLRHTVAQDEVLHDQIRYFIGIVCGHMKSAGYAESLAWQMRVPPDELKVVDFRIKDPGKSAKAYRFGAQSRTDEEMRIAPPGKPLGQNWGHAVFQLNACNYCDDVYAETADVVLGDAWLPKYEADWRGTNVVVSRNEHIDSLLKDGVARDEIELEEISPDDAARAQAGNYRHRHDGLAVRLADDDRANRWHPVKRIAAGYGHATRQRIAVIRARRALSGKSHELFLEAKQRNSIDHYIASIEPLIRDYNRHSRLPFATRAVRKVKQSFWRFVRS
jgi:coenzyme F420 hydrogenase subunit beta